MIQIIFVRYAILSVYHVLVFLIIAQSVILDIFYSIKLVIKPVPKIISNFQKIV